MPFSAPQVCAGVVDDESMQRARKLVEYGRSTARGGESGEAGGLLFQTARDRLGELAQLEAKDFFGVWKVNACG